MSIGSLLIRFHHPTKDLSFLSSLLGLACSRSWVAGSQRQTPTGSPLSGLYPDSYWTAALDFSSDEGFSKQLLLATDILVSAKETIQDIKGSGGKIEIYLQLAGAVNNGDEIDSVVLYRLGEMGVDLLIEVFA